MPSDILLEIVSPQIEGESRDDKHPNTIECQAVSFGVAQEASMQAGAGLVAGGSSFGSFVVQKQLDSASLKLFQHCAAGARIDTAKLYFRRPGEGGATTTSNEPVDYLMYEFTGLQVTNFACMGGGGSAIPDESIAFSAAGCKVHYRQIVNGQPQGAISAGYDLQKNQKI